MILSEWKEHLDKVERDRLLAAVQWYSVPGKLFAGLICWFTQHRPECKEIRMDESGRTTEFFRCTRCNRTGYRVTV